MKELLREVLQEEIGTLTVNAVPAVVKGYEGLAKFLGISKSAVQKMKKSGAIPYIQYDRVLLFEPAKVLEALVADAPYYNH